MFDVEGTVVVDKVVDESKDSVIDKAGQDENLFFVRLNDYFPLHATRTHAALQMGASPRAGVMLLRAAKAFAIAESRDYVIPDDIKRVCLPALRHRVLLEPAEEIEGGTTDAVLRSILDSIEVPR